jgi:hypothetical protein
MSPLFDYRYLLVTNVDIMGYNQKCYFKSLPRENASTVKSKQRVGVDVLVVLNIRTRCCEYLFVLFHTL